MLLNPQHHGHHMLLGMHAGVTLPKKHVMGRNSLQMLQVGWSVPMQVMLLSRTFCTTDVVCNILTHSVIHDVIILDNDTDLLSVWIIHNELQLLVPLRVSVVVDCLCALHTPFSHRQL